MSSQSWYCGVDQDVLDSTRCRDGEQKMKFRVTEQTHQLQEELPAFCCYCIEKSSSESKIDSSWTPKSGECS